ncbi:MAG TPA: site-2 protease family protein [Solirubrobacteraceae bacterium]|nr:site-2 protease family protein [Solirubrobacteraceae bacterium]
MGPRGNFQLARVFGIRIGVGFSWFVVLFLFIFTATPYFHNVLGGSDTTAYLVAVASVLSFFASLILHELGHALVARRNGLTVAGIDLWALGGLTRTSGVMRGPGPEFRVAAAGPAVSLGVIVVCVLIGGLLADSRHFFDVAVGSEGVRATPALVWLSWLATINVFVLGFNLVPALPLDGGQIAHALVWWRTGDRARATRLTGRLGQAFALLLGLAGLMLLAQGDSYGVWVILAAVFVYQGAKQAIVQGVVSERITGVTVADIMDREPVTIPAELTLLDAQEQFFLRYGWPWFAVVDPARRFLGVVRQERVDAEIASGRPALVVADALEDDLPIQIDEDQTLESLLRSEGLTRLGAMVAVDRDGVLQGVITVAQVRRALQPLVGV